MIVRGLGIAAFLGAMHNRTSLNRGAFFGTSLSGIPVTHQGRASRLLGEADLWVRGRRVMAALRLDWDAVVAQGAEPACGLAINFKALASEMRGNTMIATLVRVRALSLVEVPVDPRCGVATEPAESSNPGRPHRA